MGGGAVLDTGAALAAVSTELTTRFVAVDRPVTFGRSPRADLRIGALPLHDPDVPSLAGQVLVRGGRITVENLDALLTIHVAVGGTTYTVAPLDRHAPENVSFDILVRGARAHALAVTVNERAASAPILTDRQRHILDTYTAAGTILASDAHVSRTVGITRSELRLECQRIWGALHLAGFPLRELGETTDEIVDVWRRHRG